MTRAFEAVPQFGTVAPADNFNTKEYQEWLKLNTILSPKMSVISVPGSSLLAAETTLAQWALPPNFLNTNGEAFITNIKGTTAANANNKQLLLKLGAITLYDSTALASNAKTFDVTMTYLRLSASTAVAILGGWINNAAIAPVITTGLVPDFTTALVLKWSGVAATANADMLSYFASIQLIDQITDGLR